MAKRILSVLSIFLVLAGALVACTPNDNLDSARFAGTVYVVGEEYQFYWDMETVQVRITDETVTAADEIVHRDDIATISGNKITMLKSGRFLLWRCDTSYSDDFFCEVIISLDLAELKNITIEGEEFETNAYFPRKIAQGETLPYAMYNKNISGKPLYITLGHSDPFGGTPSISFFTVIDGYKVPIGEPMSYLTVVSSYGYPTGGVFKIATHFNSVISRGIVYKDDKPIAEDDPIYKKLGFASVLQTPAHKQNEQKRKDFLDALRKELGDDWISHPDYNRRWMEYYDAHPIFDETYSTILAPKGIYHIQLSTGQVVENALEII